MRNPRRALPGRTVLGAVAGLALSSLVTTAGWAQTTPAPAQTALPLRLRAFAVDTNANGAGRGTTGTLEIVIERWSTDAERNRLRDTLVEKGGGDALLKAVRDIEPRVGFIRTTSSLGWDIKYAQQTDTPEGRRILIGTDRPMSFFEAANRPRSADYEYLVAEVRLREGGKGEGKLVPAAMVTYDEGTRTLEIENYEQQPVRLTQVEIIK